MQGELCPGTFGFGLLISLQYIFHTATNRTLTSLKKNNDKTAQLSVPRVHYRGGTKITLSVKTAQFSITFALKKGLRLGCLCVRHCMNK